jgi:hypothetical protein
MPIVSARTSFCKRRATLPPLAKIAVPLRKAA